MPAGRRADQRPCLRDDLRGDWLTVIPTLIGVVIVTFLLTRVLPGDPAVYFAGPAATPAVDRRDPQVARSRPPLPVQFVRYLDDLVHGDLGTSLITGQPVVDEIASALPASAELTLLGLPSFDRRLPFRSASSPRSKQGSWIDHACRIVVTAGVSLPVFFTGLLLVYIFYYLLGWAPSPIGRLDVFYSAPPQVTGFYLIDSLLDRRFGDRSGRRWPS